MQVSSSSSAQGEREPQYKELPNFHQVNAKLYRGGQPRAGGIQKLASLRVNTIVNLRDDDERAEAEGREAKAAGLRYFNIPVERMGRPQDAEIERALALINDAENGVVFVHCAHGADRTGVVIAVYRISHDGWSSEQAKNEANRYGMKFWQRGMKDYIHDYYRDRSSRVKF
jgi:protein tyrosine/serine phosphatase